MCAASCALKSCVLQPLQRFETSRRETHNNLCFCVRHAGTQPLSPCRSCARVLCAYLVRMSCAPKANLSIKHRRYFAEQAAIWGDGDGDGETEGDGQGRQKPAERETNTHEGDRRASPGTGNKKTSRYIHTCEITLRFKEGGS